jgi:hypothetical protein
LILKDGRFYVENPPGKASAWPPVFNPASVSIPKKFKEITTRKGKVDREFPTGLKDAYTKRILELGAGAPD